MLNLVTVTVFVAVIVVVCVTVLAEPLDNPIASPATSANIVTIAHIELRNHEASPGRVFSRWYLCVTCI